MSVQTYAESIFSDNIYNETNFSKSSLISQSKTVKVAYYNQNSGNRLLKKRRSASYSINNNKLLNKRRSVRHTNQNQRLLKKRSKNYIRKQDRLLRQPSKHHNNQENNVLTEQHNNSNVSIHSNNGIKNTVYRCLVQLTAESKINELINSTIKSSLVASLIIGFINSLLQGNETLSLKDVTRDSLLNFISRKLKDAGKKSLAAITNFIQIGVSFSQCMINN